MSDVKIYLHDNRPYAVAAAARRLASRAYRDGLTSRNDLEETLSATDQQLVAQRDAERVKLAKEQKQRAQRQLQLLQGLVVDRRVGPPVGSAAPKRQPK